MTKRIVLIVLAAIMVIIPIIISNWLRTIDKAPERIPTTVGNGIDEMAFDKQGRIWACLGSNVGVFQDGKLIESFRFPDVGTNLFCKRIIVDHVGNVWVGTLFNGLRMFDGESWTTFFEETAIYSLAVDSTNKVWVGLKIAYKDGPSYGPGLAMFDGSSWTLYDYNNSPLWAEEIEALAVDGNNHVWIESRVIISGHFSYGLYEFDGKDWLTHELTESGKVSYIQFDKDGKAWIGHSIREAGRSAVFVTNYGAPLLEFPNIGQDVREIFVDKLGRAWILFSNGGGAARIQPVFAVYENGTLKYYVNNLMESDGYDSEYYYSATTDSQGQIWLTSSKGGFIVLIPETLKPLAKPVAVLVIFLRTGGIWFIEILLICLWLAYSLDSWRGVGLGAGMGALFTIMMISQDNFALLLEHKPFFGFSPFWGTVFFSSRTLGFALMVCGGIGGLLGRLLTKPDKRHREVSGAVIGWVVALAIGVLAYIIGFMRMS